MGEKDKVVEKDKSELPKKLLIGIVAFQVLVLAVMMLGVFDRGGSGGGSGSSSFPIWLVILIPLLATRQKRVKEENKTKMMWILVGLALVVLLGMLVFLLGAVL